jgi:hypothetical protein
MSVRKPISKRLRFNVFKRDSFTCQYCGRVPPAVVLEVDHILPVASGGKSAIDNLLTACFDCNRGKGATPLSSIPQTVSEKAALVSEKLEQVKAFERLVKAKRRHEEKIVDEVEDAFRIHFDGYSFGPKFRQSILTFLQHIPSHQLVDYMHMACSRIGRRDDSIKYFCGICWKTIREQQ